MSMYFETPLKFRGNNVVTTNGKWHNSAPLFAVASYSQDRGGFVMIFDELGEALDNVNFPSHPLSQVTALAWHPELNILVTAWENGEIKVWNGTDKDFFDVTGPQKVPIVLLEFSEKGRKLISCDSAGSLVGWKVSTKGKLATTFHQELKETITLITFRKTIKTNTDYDLEGLARAAVNGDENALDIFSNWRPKTTARKFRVLDGYDNPCFFIGTQSGSLYYVNENETCVEVLDTEGIPLNSVLHHPQKNALVIMMEGLTIGHFSIDSQGQLTEISKVKLSSRGQTSLAMSNQLVWAGNTLLAILTGELTVRMWDIETNDNYLLPTNFKQYQTEKKSPQLHESFCCLSYCKLNQTLCAGTNIGRIYFWKKLESTSSDLFENGEDLWELLNVNTVTGTVKQLMWGSVHLRTPLLSINSVTKVYVMREQTVSTAVSEKIWATQKAPTQILLETSDKSTLVHTDLQVSNMSLNDKIIALSDGRLISVYDLIIHFSDKKNQIEMSLINSFNYVHEDLIVFDRNLIILSMNEVAIKSATGANVANISTVPIEGEAIGINICGHYLTVFTLEGYVKLYDLKHLESMLPTVVKNIPDLCTDFGEIIQAKSNSNGNLIAMTIAASNLIPDGKLSVWNVEKDDLFHYQFKKTRKMGDFYDEVEKDEEENEELDETKLIHDRTCCNRIPLSMFWDIDDPRLLVCDAKKYRIRSESKRPYTALYGKTAQTPSKTPASKTKLEDEERILITMFVSAEHQIQIQDIKKMDSEAKLLGVSAPYILLLNKLTVIRQTMSDFDGLENCDKATKNAVLDFSYNLSLGNMDAAFKAIKLVQTAGVWGSLAKMCVKTRRLDVAGVCLGHMGNARGARALRIAMGDNSLQLEAKLAVLAKELGMLDEAEQLYIQCERYDLLNKLYQNRNKMNEALHIAETKDRINLKHTEHVFGKISEQAGNIKEAIIHYEKAHTHRQEVPRMLLDNPQALQVYMSKTTDSEMLKWWGQYTESQGDMNTALRIYALAGDVYNQVRALCYMREEARAAELTRANSDKAAFYHMARYYETGNNIPEAINFFNKANAYSNAVRLCKEHNLIEELWNIGLVAGNQEKLESARYFEANSHYDKAVILYHRAGLLHKALDLAFKTEQFDILQQVAAYLDPDTDPAIVEKCAEYFINNQQFDKAVDLLAVTKKYKEATTLCLRHNVQLTEDLAEKLTPDKDQVDEETKINILENLAESLMVQGNYHLATKKFTQAGDRVRAMKALLKSGDTDKIIFFAGVSRQKEIYIMAANYLQTLDWQNEPEILRNIITFYSKGKAPELLANFYVACAQIEVDEFQNYEKAYGALTEASRCLGKIATPKDPVQHKRANDIIQKRMTVIKRFIDIRRLFERGDIDGGITQCRQFLLSGGQEMEESVRRGDVYALMIQQYVKNSKFLEAKQLVGELKNVLSSSGNVSITYYLNKELIEALARGLGVTPSNFLPASSKSNIQEHQEGEIEEHVLEQ